jgi:hypothetical protein
VTSKTQAVYDYQFVLRLKEAPINDWMSHSPPFSCKDEYIEKIDNLIHESKLNNVTGLSRFTSKHLINGTTQSFDESYHRYSRRRLRIFRGEYAYHKRVNSDFIYLEDEPLKKNDFIIISFPFCSTGDKHILMDEILNMAKRMNIPVEIDCAYFGTCHGIDFDFSHEAIKAVSFSLSKGMGMGDIRSGIRYSFYKDDFPIAQQNNYNHTVLFAAKMGIHMMDKFNFDYIPNTYLKSQVSVCKELGIQPTKCMHLAIGDSDNFSNFLIDDKYYRLGIREAVKKRNQGRL